MKIETRFNIEDEVYFMCDNKVCIGYIDEIKISINSNNDQLTSYIVNSNHMRVHKTSENLFSSKEELLKSL